jgi:hypothetical protein
VAIFHNFPRPLSTNNPTIQHSTVGVTASIVHILRIKVSSELGVRKAPYCYDTEMMTVHCNVHSTVLLINDFSAFLSSVKRLNLVLGLKYNMQLIKVNRL